MKRGQKLEKRDSLYRLLGELLEDGDQSRSASKTPVSEGAFIDVSAAKRKYLQHYLQSQETRIESRT